MFGIFRFFRRRRLAKRPIPSTWLAALQEHVPFFAQFDGALRERFLSDLKIFVWEKHFIAAGGMEIDDTVRVVIAATAVRLTVHLDVSYFNRLTEIIVYPSHFVTPRDEDGVILGEAHDWGTVVLSWQAVLDGLKNPRDGHDTATHEFAHVLDRADGEFDGTPELRALGHYRPWAEVMSRNFEALQQRRRAQRKVLRSYGAQNEAEFFAVATEAFFEKPRQMRDRTPELYEELKRFYGFDPAARA